MKAARKPRRNAVGWVRGELAPVRARLESYAAFRLVKRVFIEFGHDAIPDRAASVAYFSFLSIFPLILGIISILAFFVPYEVLLLTVLDTATRVLPGSGDFVEENVASVIRLREVGGIFSLLVLLWSGSNAFAAIRRAINRVWDIERDRTFLPGKLRDLIMVVLTGLLFIFSMLLPQAVGLVDRVIGRPPALLLTVSFELVGFVSAFVVFLVVYKFIPNRRITWSMAWPGAILASAVFQTGTRLFLFYLTNYANYQSVYGSLGSVVILLFWIYASAVILLLGIEFNSELYRMRRGIRRGGSQHGNDL